MGSPYVINFGQMAKLIAAMYGGLTASLVTAIICKWTLVYKIQPCMQQLGQWQCMRHWLVDRLMGGSPFRTAMMEIGGTPIVNTILRMLGAKVGKSSIVIDLVVGADVDMIEIGDRVFSASMNVFIGRAQIAMPNLLSIERNLDQYQGFGLHQKHVLESDEECGLLMKPVQGVQFKPIRIGNDVLLAEQAMVLGSGELAESQICGPITLIDRKFEPCAIVMGSPPGRMGFNTSPSEEMKSSVWLLWTAQRFMVPLLFLAILSMLIPIVTSVLSNVNAWPNQHWALESTTEGIQIPAPTSGQGRSDIFWSDVANKVEHEAFNSIVVGAVAYAMVLMLMGGLHWLIIMTFNFSTGNHTVYKGFMLMWGLADELQRVVFGIFGLFIQGTPLMRVYLRMLGARIGARVFWDTLPPIETRALDISDNVVVEDGAMLFGHVLDHGVLQFGQIHVGEGSVINTHVNVQPHVRIGSNALVDCLSAVLKYETLPDDTSWIGSPCVRREAAIERFSAVFTAVHD